MAESFFHLLKSKLLHHVLGRLRRRPSRPVRAHRDLLQPGAAAFYTGLPNPSTNRAPAQPLNRLIMSVLPIRFTPLTTICYMSGSLEASSHAQTHLSHGPVRVPDALLDRAGLPKLPGGMPLARWLPVPTVRAPGSVRPELAATPAVRFLSPSGFGNGGHGNAPHPDTACTCGSGRPTW